MNELIPVLMSKEDAALFILFQKNYDNIAFMVSQGVFDMKRGNIVLSFDEKGSIRSLKKEVYIQRDYPQLTPNLLIDKET